MSSQSKDNTCPACKGKGKVWRSGITNGTMVCPTCKGKGWDINSKAPRPKSCPVCNGSGQQDKYANSIPKTYEEKQQDKLKPSKPGQQEGKPTTVEGFTPNREIPQADLNSTVNFSRLQPPFPADSKPEKPQCTCGAPPDAVRVVHRTDGPCYLKEPDQLRELLAKYFKAYNAYDGETEQTIEAIEALISQREVEVLEAVRRGWPVDSPEYPYMSSTIDRYINERRRSNG